MYERRSTFSWKLNRRVKQVLVTRSSALSRMNTVLYVSTITGFICFECNMHFQTYLINESSIFVCFKWPQTKAEGA